MRVMQLRLVNEENAPREETAIGRVFAHWVFMLGKNPRRCALGPGRRKAIDRALALPNKPAVLMMTAYGNIETAVEAMKRGAVRFSTSTLCAMPSKWLLHQAPRK